MLATEGPDGGAAMAGTGNLLVSVLDRDAPVPVRAGPGTTADQLAAALAVHCNLSPAALPLFAFRQGGRWLSPGDGLQEVEGPLDLRLRFHTAAGRAGGHGPSSLNTIDPVAFRYYYTQVRKDFDLGLVTRREREKWWQQPWRAGPRHREDRPSEEDLTEESLRVMELISTNMSIDVMEEKRDKKELSMKSTLKAYIPADYWSPMEKMMARYLLPHKCETYVEKLLKVYQPTMDPSRLKEEFLMRAERYFPFYFGETFSAELEGGERQEAEDVRLVVSPPRRDLPVSVAMVRRQEDGSLTEPVCNISDICNIALRQDNASIEISRKNGIPLYFKLGSQGEAASLLSLLCGYYRLAEKCTFSLCTELRCPRLEELLAAKAHGPVTREWGVEKLQRKAAFKKGSFLVRQSPTEHDRMYLDYCAHEGCRPEVVAILVESAQPVSAVLEVRVGQRYRLDPAGQQPLPAALRQSWASVTELLLALRTVPSHIELADCLHPSEYDFPPELLPCRTDNQRREDLLGAGRGAQARDRLVIHPSSLSKLETSLKEGAVCQVWQGEWGRRGADRETVAIKQLKRDFKSKFQESFMEQARRCMDWDDGSLASVKGLCLPTDSEPPVLVTEWFPLGPLSAYLAGQRGSLQPVDLLEAATCLARALYWLDDRGLVHGEIRARNLMVAAHVPGHQFKVKLCEGGLAGPQREDVHWLDFEQLQEVLDASRSASSPLALSRSGDVWSFGTTLWEIFSWGAAPLPGPGALEAARQYLAGYRLPCPGTGLPAAVYPLMRECWEPHPEARKRPQAIMRDMNQRLFHEHNSRRAHEYVTIDDTGVSTLTPSLNTSTDGSGDRSVHQPPSSGLVPMFTEASRKLLESCRGSSGQFGSTSALLSTGLGQGSSRSGSSLAGSLFNTDMSGVTCQTSLDWGSSPGGLYSISSIYQLDGDQVECNQDYPLGEGNFGVVYKGVRTKTDGDWEQVAIKKVKDTDTMPASAVDDMEREVNLMKKLSHENIVKIVGVMHDGSSTIIVMEYIREGSLDRYLQVNRHNVDFKQLFGYSQNIVDGMDYLTQNKIIHRDLAARNILVADQETVKISDFGLARTGGDGNDCYVMSSATNIPVKWEAIECLTHRKYSHKSDVWSFGVTLWEMFAFGQTPTMAGCEDFFTSEERGRQDYKDWLGKLEEGIRLPRTEVCPDFLYSRVMLRCWQKDPAARPSFLNLRQELKQAELEVT